MKQTIDTILSIDINYILEKYIKLTKKGKDYKAICPFHDDKNPSMSISPSKGIYKCFSCGAGGNSIKFVMEYQKLNFVEAIKEISNAHGLSFDLKKRTDEEKKIDKHLDELMIVNDFSSRFFQENLTAKENPLAFEYALSRWSINTIKVFEIGYAPNKWDCLKNYAKDKSVKKDILLEADLLKTSKNKVFDNFRDRLIFPISNKYGRTIGFIGRKINNDKDFKYLNTCDTKVFKKGKSLFGLNLAYRAIKEQNKAYLVEGNPDVMRLHEIGIYNVVAPLGTALTNDQINELKSITENVVLLSDNDNAGIKAMERSANMLNKAGLFVFMATVPGEKQDPDSFFKNKKKQDFINFEHKFAIDYIAFILNKLKDKILTVSEKNNYINNVFNAITNLPESTWSIYEGLACEYITPKKLITERFKELKKEKKEHKNNIPEHVKLSDYEEYGFYIDDGVYWFNTKNGAIRGSNFLMKPLFHVQSNINVKRLFEVENIYGKKKIIELAQKDLIALSRFNEAIEGLGNFLFEGGDSELKKLKRYLYAETETCTEITKLGWQRKGFFAWSNGIQNGIFTKVDRYGIAKFNDDNYYLPAHSQIYDNEDDELFSAEKRFIFVKDHSKISLYDYLVALVDVFGDNGKIAFCYLVASIFRDVIFHEYKFFPILNLFGFKGSGKSEMGESLLHFFGPKMSGINLPNSTEPATADYISQTRNAVALLDEYRNNFEPSKIEFLKGLWKGIGRTRMNMDRDKKKETTAVETGIILCGQEMPTADIALFSRLIYLTFSKVKYNQKERDLFTKLKEIEEMGITHLTNELLEHREYFVKTYSKRTVKIGRKLEEKLKNEGIETRIYNNWLTVISAFSVLEDRIDMPFTTENILDFAPQQMIIQNRETKSSNEMSTFWKIIQYLYADGLITEGVDFKVEFQNKIKTDKLTSEWSTGKNILYVQQSRIIPQYRKQGKQMGENILPSDSIDYYLRNDKSYLGKKLSMRFKAVDPKTGVELSDGDDGNKKYKVTTAYAFLYDELDITLTNNSIEEEKPF